MIGTRFAHYRIEEKIGEGGMGVVYRAEDERLHRTVALKFIRADLVSAADARARFIREAQSASALTHPNICTVYAIEEDAGKLCIALELIRGQTIRARTDLQKDVRLLLDCAVQAAEGLAAAHQAGIVHRDIKSINILVTDRGVVKIMDFGLAKQLLGRTIPGLDDLTTQDLTGVGISVGTPSYMSPEQAYGRPVTAASDVFSMGVVLYEVAVGHLPFTGTTMTEIIDAVIHREPVPPTQLNPSLPGEFERIVLKALRKEAAERYRDAGDLLVDLKTLRRQVDSGVRSATTTAATTVRQPPAWKSVVLVVAAIVLLIAASVGATAVMSRSGSAGSARAGPAKSTLAVMNFENRVGEVRFDRYGQGATELLTVDLARGLTNLELVSSQRLFDVVHEMKRDLQRLDRAVATEVARRAGARFMVHGEILELAGSVIMKTEVIEVEGGRLVAAQRMTGITDANLIDKIDELGRLMRDDVKGLR